jgi:hypothetical protein
MGRQGSIDEFKLLENNSGNSSKPLGNNAVRKMGVDLLPDRKLAASISGYRRIGAMYTTPTGQYAIEIFKFSEPGTKRAP